MSDKMHVAVSGAREGQWVMCYAEGNCPLGGIHANEYEMKHIVKEWAGKRALADVSLDDYREYMWSKIAGTLEATKRPMETKTEKRARLGVERLTQPVERVKPFDALLAESMVEANLRYDYVSHPAEYCAVFWRDVPEIRELSIPEQVRLAENANVISHDSLALAKKVQDYVAFLKEKTE